jgi:phosphate:Na+ symporter
MDLASLNEFLQVGLGLLGGLAIFLYGMNLMSGSLQDMAGNRMKAILSKVTKNPLLAVAAGAFATAVLQSSSATTVMAIGFVSAGLMSLRQAIPLIMGANIGTTITAQIIAFKLSDYVLAFVFTGFLIMQLAKEDSVKFTGRALFGFGLLFLGIDTMGGVMKPLASNAIFTEMMAEVTGIPLLGVAVGTVMTLIVQSSSATIAVLQNFASQPGVDGASLIGLDGAIPILLGDNLGTTITALLAAIGQSRDAKRVALSHCVFNLSGALLFVWFVGPFATLVAALTPGPELEVIARQIANAHTLFNVTMTALWLPLIPLMVKIVMALLPDHPRRPGSVRRRVTNSEWSGEGAAALEG